MEFKEELQRFRERVGTTRFQGLILPGSLQATTAALLIGALEPQRVAFLLTPDTHQTPAQAARLLDCDPTPWQSYAEDHTSTLQVYRSLRTIIEAWSDLAREQIAVDVTGGTKPMSIGLAKAAYVLDITALYIESDFKPDANGRMLPQPGTQRLAPPPDPYLVFGDLEAAEAIRRYAAHDYLGAERMFARLAQRVPESAGVRYAAYAELARAYAAWDAFDLPQAARILTKLLEHPVQLAATYPQLSSQAAALQRLSTVAQRTSGRGQQALATLADPQTILPLLGSLWANARRREDQGRLDVAALLRYRCLELISQHRLATHGVLSEQPDFSAALARQPDLEQRYEAVQRQQGRRRAYPLPDRAIGLFVGYMLLVALDDSLVRGYAIRQIEQRTAARNKSILAHGYQLITATEYQPFAQVVETLLERLFALLEVDRTAWEQTYRFVTLAEHSTM